MNGSCLGEFANPSPRRVRSFAERGPFAAAVSFSRLMVAADGCPLGAAVPLPAGFVAPVSWFVEKLAVGDLRCAARVECESGACASVESGKPLIVCMPGLARNLVHVRSPDRRWLGDLARNGATRCNGRFPKSVGCSDACEARFADGRSVRSSA